MTTDELHERLTQNKNKLQSLARRKDKTNIDILAAEELSDMIIALYCYIGDDKTEQIIQSAMSAYDKIVPQHTI